MTTPSPPNLAAGAWPTHSAAQHTPSAPTAASLGGPQDEQSVESCGWRDVGGLGSLLRAWKRRARPVGEVMNDPLVLGFPGDIFGIGRNAGGAEFRSSDANGRPVDAAAETETQRAERIRALQDQRLAAGPREMPRADAASVLTEWMAARPANPTAAFPQPQG